MFNPKPLRASTGGITSRPKETLNYSILSSPRFSPSSRPRLRGMQHTNNLNSFYFGENSIDHYKICPGNHQLASAFFTPSMADLWMCGKMINLLLDTFVLLNSCLWICFSDVINQFIPVCNCLWQPNNDHDPASMRFSKARRLAAKCFCASSFETHWVFGSSASLMPSSTCDRNQVS